MLGQKAASMLAYTLDRLCLVLMVRSCVLLLIPWWLSDCSCFGTEVFVRKRGYYRTYRWYESKPTFYVPKLEASYGISSIHYPFTQSAHLAESSGLAERFG